jgi:ketosteroid isomerase-like protein
VSQENVELVRSLMPAPEVNLAQIFRDDLMWAAMVEANARFIDPDFEAVGTVLGAQTRLTGIDGFREFLLDWLAPWAAYRSEIERTVDLGDQVLAIYRVFGLRPGSSHELASTAAWLWTIREGRIIRIKGFADPAEALEEAGLEE